MLEVLRFIFSGFWIWLGTLLLVGVIGASVARAILALWGVRDGD